MKTTLNPTRLLLEVLLIVASAEIIVMLVLPELATGLGTLAEGLLDVAMLMLLSGPAVYWRFMRALKTELVVATPLQLGVGKSGYAVVLTAITQILGLLLTAGGVTWQSNNLDRFSQARFEQSAERIESEVVRRLNQSIYGLKGARGAIAASPTFNRQAFRAYVESRDLPTEFPGIRGFGFIQRVERGQLARFVAHERADGEADFVVHSAGSAPDLYVVKYVEPIAANRAALGFDQGQEFNRRAAVEYSAATGEPTLLAGIELLQDDKRSPGFLFFLPVYRKGSTAQTPEQRQHDLLGILYAPIVASELFGSVAAVTDNMIDFELFDGTEISPQNLIFDADGLLASTAAVQRGSGISPRKYVVGKALNVGSRVLTLRTSSTPRFDASQDRSSLTIIGFGGTLVSFLMAISVWLLAMGRQRARDLANAMTAELDRMAMVVQHTDNAVTIMDRDMRILWVNRGFTQITGYSLDEAKGQTPGELLSSGKSDPQAIQTLLDGARRGESCRVELINRAKDGREYWADTEVQPTLDKQGQLVGFMEIGTDITERHQWAERLRQSEATFSASFRAAASGMGFLSPKGQWLRANPALCEFLGYTELELHELTLHDTNHPDEWDIDQLQIKRLADGEIPVYQRAKRYIHRDGHTVWGLASISVVRAEDGKPQFVISQIVDITARKRAEEALSLSNALMEETQAVAKVGGWELNLATGHLYWTSETFRILETSPDAFDPTIEASLDFYLPASRERIQAALQAAMEHGQGYDLELEALTAAGRQLDVRTTCSATLEDGKVVRLSGIFQDITERTQYERSLHEAREKAELATRSKGQFLANMSHEIRTPMNAILGMLTLLHSTDLNSRQRDYATKSEHAAKSLLGLINDILDFSKVEAGKMTLDPQPFRLDRLMRNLAVILSSNLGGKGIDVLFDIDPAIPDVLLGDSMRLQQVLINLGGNAIKFTAQGQVVLAVRLQGLETDTATLEFAVRDSGIGIALENQVHIFTGFSQAEASTTRKFGGTGLGLSISQRLVELMGGQLHLKSALGEGSTFSFSLQLPLVQQVPPELVQEPVAATAPRRTLVVDNNPVARELLGRMARSWTWPTTLAESGEAALEQAQAQLQPGGTPFEVVYMDWQMSGMDGWSTTARLRQLYTAHGAKQPLVVMVSGSSRETLEQRTHEEQSLLNGFLMKPVTASMLLNATLNASSTGAGLRRATRTAAGQRRLAGMRILVVEDNLINQQVAEELLTTEGASVVLAANGLLGVEAIAAAAKAQQFDAVLMDIQMPVLDGFAATRRVREDLQLHTLPIIAMTANALQSDREDCLAAGMNEHVGKPFDLKQLVHTLLRVTGFQVQPDSAAGSSPAASPAVPSLPPAPVSPVVDVSAALQRMGGLGSLYLRSAQEFIRAVPAQLRELQDHLQTDSARCAMLAHTLKGTAALLGATALAAQAAVLETQCKDSAGAPQRQAALDALQAVAAQALQSLQQVVDGWEPAPATLPAPDAAPDAQALRAAMLELTQLLDANDLTALEKFASLRDVIVAIPEALLYPLEGALQDLDLAAASDKCRAIERWLEGSTAAQ